VAGSRTGSTRPPRPGCSTCSMRRSTRAGRCAGPATNLSSARFGRTAGWPVGPAGSWPTTTLAGHRCTGCSPRRPPRSWTCSTSGARPTGPTASSPTAAPTWAGAGCRRPACGGCFSLLTSTFGLSTASGPVGSQAVPRLGRVHPELDLDLRYDALPGGRDGGAHHRGPGLPQDTPRF